MDEARGMLAYGVCMARVLVTGMSGTGKSTLLAELSARGLRTVDTDYDGWVLGDLLWNEERMAALLEVEDSVVVSGTVENQGGFYDRFDHVVLLSAPVEVLIKRVRTRSNNPYGHTKEERQEIRKHVAEVEPLLRRGTSIELDGRLPIATLADIIESLTVPKAGETTTFVARRDVCNSVPALPTRPNRGLSED